MRVIQEFREFAVKGNVIDMAVGIIIGVAFTKVVNSVVNDLLMPPIGLLIGGVQFDDLQVILREPTVREGVKMDAVAIRYGSFINTVIEFLIIAFCAFLVVRVMNRIIRKRETAPPTPGG